MYSWQLDKAFTSPLIAGQPVKLNERWSAYNYLQREFGSMFPASIKETYGDHVTLNAGKNGVKFARQCLSPLYAR
jgi:hypothetical protein